MITLFRKFRKNLLKEGSVRRYLLYASGEILLVVVGILIALQVNNWNESRKQQNLEVEVLREISSDLDDDIASLENDIRLNETYIKYAQLIRDELNSTRPYHDSLSRYFGILPFNTTYTIKTSGYENLKNRGFEIIANDSVRTSITDLYASSYSFLKESQVTADRLTYDVFTPRYLEYFDEISGNVLKNELGRRVYYTPADYASLREDKEFSKLIGFLVQIKNENLYSISYTFIQLNKTKKTVDQYLKSLTAN